MSAVQTLQERWPESSGAVLGPEGLRYQWGDTERTTPLASVSKPITAMACWVAVEEGTLRWDRPAGPIGSTVAHLLAHTSGVAFDSDTVVTPPGTRRIYSNVGFDLLADALGGASQMPWREYVHAAVCEPLGMTATSITGSAAKSYTSNVADLTRFAAELLRPTLVDPSTHALATSVQWPELAGILPGFGQQHPNPWGLGVEIRGAKRPHWTGTRNSRATFGHFGASGTFLWVDPTIDLAVVALGTRAFDGWAGELWPVLSDLLIAEFA